VEKGRKARGMGGNVEKEKEKLRPGMESVGVVLKEGK